MCLSAFLESLRSADYPSPKPGANARALSAAERSVVPSNARSLCMRSLGSTKPSAVAATVLPSLNCAKFNIPERTSLAGAPLAWSHLAILSLFL